MEHHHLKELENDSGGICSPVATGCGGTDTPWTKIHVKHPHERGEEITADWIASGPLETPPRAWGGVVQQQLQQYDSGNTPTCVGRRA